MIHWKQQQPGRALRLQPPAHLPVTLKLAVQPWVRGSPTHAAKAISSDHPGHVSLGKERLLASLPSPCRDSRSSYQDKRAINQLPDVLCTGQHAPGGSEPPRRLAAFFTFWYVWGVEDSASGISSPVRTGSECCWNGPWSQGRQSFPGEFGVGLLKSITGCSLR